MSNFAYLAGNTIYWSIVLGTIGVCFRELYKMLSRETLELSDDVKEAKRKFEFEKKWEEYFKS